MDGKTPSRDANLNEIEHEVSRILRVLDIWHGDTPGPLHRELQRRLSSIENLIYRERGILPGDIVRHYTHHPEQKRPAP